MMNGHSQPQESAIRHPPGTVNFAATDILSSGEGSYSEALSITALQQQLVDEDTRHLLETQRIAKELERIGANVRAPPCTINPSDLIRRDNYELSGNTNSPQPAFGSFAGTSQRGSLIPDQYFNTSNGSFGWPGESVSNETTHGLGVSSQIWSPHVQTISPGVD